jgi:ubiquilin
MLDANPAMRGMMSNPAMLEAMLNPQMMGLMQAMGGLGGLGGMGGGMGDLAAQLGGVPPAPAAPADTRPPEVRFEAQLTQMRDMGFTDDAVSIRALIVTGGSVQLAIERILDGRA